MAMLPEQFNARPRKMLDVRGEPGLNRVEFGRILARAFDLMGQRKATALTLNVDEAQVSRWCKGTEPAPFERLLAELPGFRGAFLVALAEQSTGHDIEHEFTIRWRRRA